MHHTSTASAKRDAVVPDLLEAALTILHWQGTIPPSG